MVIKSHTGFMLYNLLYEGSTCLAYARQLAVSTQDVVDDILETEGQICGFGVS